MSDHFFNDLPDMPGPQDVIPANNEAHSLAMSTSRPLSQHPVVVYLATLSEGSRRTIFHALETIADYLSGGRLDVFSLEWSAVRYSHAMAVRAYLAAHYKPATANRALSALRQVLHHAWKLDQVAAEDYYRVRDVPNVRAHTLPAGRDLSPGEIASLMRICAEDLSPAGARDAALVALMYTTGIRRREAVNLDHADYRQEDGALYVRKAKGGGEHLAFVGARGARHALDDWLLLRGDEEGALFWPVNKAGHMENRRLSAQAVYSILRKRAQQAGVDQFSPHDLRRTLAGNLLDAGVDIVTVQRMLGHANVDTTARYDRRPIEAQRHAASLIHVPYHGRQQPGMEPE